MREGRDERGWAQGANREREREKAKERSEGKSEGE